MLPCLMDTYSLSGFYREGFPLLQECMSAVTTVLDRSVPDLAQHFEGISVHPTGYLHQRYMTLFIMCLPLPTVLHLWDGGLCLGSQLFLPISVTMLSTLKPALLNKSFEDILCFLRTTAQGVDKEIEASSLGLRLLRESLSLELPPDIAQELTEAARPHCEEAKSSSTKADSSSATWDDPLVCCPQFLYGDIFFRCKPMRYVHIMLVVAWPRCVGLMLTAATNSSTHL